MKIYIVGSNKNKFFPADNIREKFFIDEKHVGDNIDQLNSWYCELTGLYYLWKHCNDDIVGLEHYKRYFINDNGNLLSECEIREILNDNDIICSMHHPNPTVESIVLPPYKPFYSRFISFAEETVGKDYADCCKYVMNSDTMCLCNMFIATKELVDEYCNFIFSLTLKYKESEENNGRVLPNRILGWITESLFRAYLLYKNKKIKNVRIGIFNPYKYSILVYNFNNYEIMREPAEVDPECEYVYVTDNPDYKNQSKTWNVIIDKDLDGMSTFDKCYNVRFNLFKYVTAPVCIYLDGSIRINRPLRKFYEDFIASGADLGVNIHPTRNRVDVEYLEWIRTRNYPVARADTCLKMFNQIGYDVDKLGLCQGTCRICKNTKLNATIDKNVLNLLRKLGTEKEIERLDQTVYTVVLSILHKRMNFSVFAFSQQVLQSEYMTWCFHGRSIPIPWNKGNDKSDGYLFGKPKNLYKIF